MRWLILIILLFFQTSCEWFKGVGTPFYFMTNLKVPEGTPTFQKGFKDGCESVVYARGNNIYRARYGYRYDPKLINNSEYGLGRSRGYTWCFLNTLAGVTGPQTSFDRYILPHGYDDTFNAASWDDVGLFTSGGIFGVGGTGGDLSKVLQNFTTTDDGQTLFNNRELIWAGGSCGQIFGQDC